MGVYFQNDNINTFDKDAELRLTIMSSIAQDEVRKLSERTRFGFKRAQENSVLLGQNNLFGYNKVDGRLEIVEPEAAVVREVFERYAAGDLGLRAIANDLDSRGVRGRQGKPLTYSTLYGMIRNPKYKGCYAGRRYASRDYRDKRSYRLSADKWLVHKDDRVPAIVPEALWEQANRLLASRGKTMKAHAQASQNRYAYSGKLICARHGTTFHRHVYKSKSRGESECWNCKLYREKGKQGGCDSPTVYSHELDRILERVFEQITDDRSAAVQEYIDNLRAFAAQQDNAPALAQVEQEIEAVTCRKDKLLDLALAGALSNDEFKQRNETCNEQLAALEQQRTELQNADKTLEERIRSRFEWGLMADIGTPDYETRMAILRKKIEADEMNLSDEILNYIATNIKSNIRELEGALNKLLAYSNLEKTDITMEIAQKELQNIITPDKPKEITPQLIIEVVSEHFQISLDQMISKNRSKDIARPRQIAMYLCKNMTDTPLDSIGALLGGRDHSTIIHGVQKISDEYESDETTRSLIDTIKKKINPN